MKRVFDLPFKANLTQSKNFNFTDKKNAPECSLFHGFT